MNGRLAGKTAVITGGNSGIGLATARLFKTEGAKLVIMGRNAETLEQSRSELGNDTVVVQGNVSILSDLDKLYEQVKSSVGQIDVLVVNAGIVKLAPVKIIDEEYFDAICDTNFKGAFFTVQKAIPLLNKGASVILVTSVLNQMGRQNFSVYSATKAALRSLARSFAAELVNRKIRVNALSPGPIDTPIYSRLGLSDTELENMSKSIAAQVPLRRFGTSEEMAKAAVFLACDDSSYVVGTELIADGGFSQL